MNARWPHRMTAGRRKKLAIAKSVEEQRNILIAALAEDLIAEIEQYLRQVAKR